MFSHEIALEMFPVSPTRAQMCRQGQPASETRATMFIVTDSWQTIIDYANSGLGIVSQSSAASSMIRPNTKLKTRPLSTKAFLPNGV